jgi:hypothetical protein
VGFNAKNVLMGCAKRYCYGMRDEQATGQDVTGTKKLRDESKDEMSLRLE